MQSGLCAYGEKTAFSSKHGVRLHRAQLRTVPLLLCRQLAVVTDGLAIVRYYRESRKHVCGANTVLKDEG
jgi:hypothetical protein